MARPAGAENVVVRRSGVHGRGLFAARDIRKGERVIEYVGEKVGKREGTRRTEAQWARGRIYTFELNSRQDVDGGFAWNTARLANHSCAPNCESEIVRGRIWIVALRDIAAGQEITYDYNFPVEEDLLKCRCGAKRCRGYVVGSGYGRQLAAWKRRHGVA
ncbi:MAG: SET domain-containing protein [Thermoplasmatota archaeon]|nr:SET domain-containing protein-lysine N-methyltransferase [Halobacteriales archaeon]